MLVPMLLVLTVMQHRNYNVCMFSEHCSPVLICVAHVHHVHPLCIICYVHCTADNVRCVHQRRWWNNGRTLDQRTVHMHEAMHNMHTHIFYHVCKYIYNIYIHIYIYIYILYGHNNICKYTYIYIYITLYIINIYIYIICIYRIED